MKFSMLGNAIPPEMLLANVRIEGAKAGDKPYKMADDKGTYLFVQPARQRL